MKLLLESGEFLEALSADVARARDFIYAQTLSFEDDAGGQSLAKLLRSRPGLDRRLVIDSYTRHIINDRYLYSPSNLRDAELQAEARGTRALVAALENEGVRVKWVNPMGLMMRKLSARNHKKVIGVDRTSAYVGGINFSAHNFEWHDLMLRFDEPALVDFLREDFLQTWRGHDQGTVRDFGSACFMLLDGRRSELLSQPLIDLLGSARKSVFVESPYLSSPYYEILGAAARRGVEVSVLSPASNNWNVYDAYTRWEVQHHGLKLFHYPERMNHVKAMLIDAGEPGSTLVLGSSNFDYFSHHLHQELIVIVRDPGVVKDFTERVFKADLAVSRAAAEPYDPTRSGRAKFAMQTLFKTMHFVNKGRCKALTI